MRYYRDLQLDETLQVGDERLSGHLRQWVPVEAVWIGQPVAADSRLRYRRPVDLPTLQRVTPEAIREMEGREAWVILFRHKESIHCRYCVVRWDAVASRWWGTPAGEENPLDWQWYIEPSTIPEVT